MILTSLGEKNVGTATASAKIMAAQKEKNNFWKWKGNNKQKFLPVDVSNQYSITQQEVKLIMRERRLPSI